jgi:hypothetical protein
MRGGGGKQKLASTRWTRVNKYQEYLPKRTESALLPACFLTIHTLIFENYLYRTEENVPIDEIDLTKFKWFVKNVFLSL